jgi:hypothetical protein
VARTGGPVYSRAVPLLTPLTPDERATFVVVSLPQKALRKLVGQLGTAPPGTRVDAMTAWDLGWSLVDYYENDAEVAAAVDRVLRTELGTPPLVAAVQPDGAAKAVSDLLLSVRDPARDLAWAILCRGGDDAGELASACVQTIIREFDEADARAEESEQAPPPEPAPADPGEDAARALARETQRAEAARDRAKKRLEGMKSRLVELERALGAARQELRTAESGRERLEAERDQLATDASTLRAKLRAGTPAEVARLGEELDAAQRRVRSLEDAAERAREGEAALTARLRALEGEQRPPRAAADESESERAAGSGVAWSLPIFTDEFYDSLRRWDRKVVRNAFEKAYRLAEDWRHPSLRAIPLEGLPDYYRLRVATDVRLIYRPVDGGRVEILSLIDREDLSRYVRQAKTR